MTPVWMAHLLDGSTWSAQQRCRQVAKERAGPQMDRRVTTSLIRMAMMMTMTMMIMTMTMLMTNLLENDKREEATVRFDGFDSGTGEDT